MVVVLLLTGGAVAAIFAMKKDDPAPAPVGGTPFSFSPEPPTDTTQAPQPAAPEPTLNPVNNPTDIPLYPQPSEEDCSAIASGSTVSDQENLFPSEYLLELDVSLESDMEEETWRNALNAAFQEKLFPAGSTSRRLVSDNRNLQTSLPNFVIANGKASQSVVTADQCSDGASANCFRVNMTLTLWLRDANTKMWQVVGYLGETLGDTPVDFLALNDQLSNLVVIGGSALSPTEQPSLSPSSNPTFAPSTSPSASLAVGLNPTVAPAVSSPNAEPTLAPTLGPSGTPSRGPTKLPTVTPSTNPTSAPFPGPSPPPTKAPTKFPTASPSKSPTRTPTFAPTVQSSEAPTSRVTLPPSKSPSGRPSVAPSKAPSKRPTLAPTTMPQTQSPTDRPTFAFNGQVVPVYGDWDNGYTAGADVGKYFLYVPSDWEAVFGSVPGPEEGASYKVVQWRNGVVIWQGDVTIWGDFPSRTYIPSNFEHGRRGSGALNNQWVSCLNTDTSLMKYLMSNPRSFCAQQTGDIIDRQGVAVVSDWENAANPGNDVGTYFLFLPSDWEAIFGTIPAYGTSEIFAVEHRRNNEIIWQGDVIVWSENRSDIPAGYYHGRRNPRSVAVNGQWVRKLFGYHRHTVDSTSNLGSFPMKSKRVTLSCLLFSKLRPIHRIGTLESEWTI